MKRKGLWIVFTVLAAAVLLCSCGDNGLHIPAEVPVTGVNTPTDATSTDAAVKNTAALYLQIIDGLKAEYGDGGLTENGMFITGVGYVRLCDLDGDGTDEMICAYHNPARGERYPYLNEYAVFGEDSRDPLFEPRQVSNFGNGDAPGMGLLEKNGMTWIEESFGGVRTAYLHIKDGELFTDIAYEEILTEDGIGAVLNGEETDADTAAEKLAAFEKGGTVSRTEFFFTRGSAKPGEILAQTDAVIETLEEKIIG